MSSVDAASVVGCGGGTLVELGAISFGGRQMAKRNKSKNLKKIENVRARCGGLDMFSEN